ncbi:MAG TPA: ABC transporter permease [Kiritimatiellia bacterium]|nr:ABC transporter permease [Kiritimatiellia bacterium]HRZ12434.1 ABC transporter permease [Kiritimatiellia bacterium]HSA17808.1 ABC transporter permease [Kiritimatiellia bacterium]
MIRLRLEKRPPLPDWAKAAIPLAAVAATLLLAAAPILAAGGNLWRSYYYLFYGALGSRVNLLESCVKASPLIFTGLGVAFAFRARFWNIGAEGQLMAGAIVAGWLGIALPIPSRLLHLAVIIGAAFLAGGLWAAIPAWLKFRLRVDDVVTTLLFNYIMMHVMGALLFGPLQQPDSSWPQSPEIRATAQYPVLVARSRFHLGIPLALVAAGLVWLIHRKTVLGYESRAVGANPVAAHFGGVPTSSVLLKTAVLSGGLAAMAGVGEVCAVQHHLLMDLSPGYGYSGIVVAMLGNLHPAGVVLAALFFSAVSVGSQTMSRMTGVPSYISEVIQGLALVVMLVALLLTEYRVRVRRGAGTGGGHG